jgi:hypothetical protein
MANQDKRKDTKITQQRSLRIFTQYPSRPSIYTEYPAERKSTDASKPTQKENADAR